MGIFGYDVVAAVADAGDVHVSVIGVELSAQNLRRLCQGMVEKKWEVAVLQFFPLRDNIRRR